jgi:predicted nucleotidyltransferase
MLETAVNRMKTRICSILGDEDPSIYLYGSVTTGDFRYGWSDIDILCLTGHGISEEHARELLELRQKLAREYGDEMYRLFEGAFLPVHALLTHEPDRIVYWGTSGQRLADRYEFNSFSTYELKTSGWLLCGPDVRSQFPMPSYDELRRDVVRYYETIRKCAAETDDSLYACGWLLDIARCLYTLRTGKVIAKTAAGEWALWGKLCNVPEAMRKTLAARKNPQAYKNTPQYKAWASRLGPEIQKFADVLERELG